MAGRPHQEGSRGGAGSTAPPRFTVDVLYYTPWRTRRNSFAVATAPRRNALTSRGGRQFAEDRKAKRKRIAFAGQARESDPSGLPGRYCFSASPRHSGGTRGARDGSRRIASPKSARAFARSLSSQYELPRLWYAAAKD